MAYALHAEIRFDDPGAALAAQLEIDLTTAPAGVYLLRYSSGEAVRWMRLVKQ
jgi:hypothetical protein